MDHVVASLEHEGHDISFDPLFNALTDVHSSPTSASTRDRIIKMDLAWQDLSFAVPAKSGPKTKAKANKASAPDGKNQPGIGTVSEPVGSSLERPVSPSSPAEVAETTTTGDLHPHEDDIAPASSRTPAHVTTSPPAPAAGAGAGAGATTTAARDGMKLILKGVSGNVRTGQMLAIMGASGAGKSSLLNLLAGRITSNPGASVTGNVLVNGQRRDYNTFKKLAAYVLQDDDMFEELTVREQLMYTAQLRLPSSMPLDRKKLRVDKVIQELGLSKVASSLIGGTTIRGISGGERKRVSIGTELVTDASLIFLDEPTSGLDAFNALNVMTNLRRLASNGRTVISTIHQPRSSIFQLFDVLLLLSEGRSIYFGPAKDAIPYFNALQFPAPESFNPADFFLDLISVDPRSADVEANTMARIEYLADKHDAAAPTVIPAPDSEAEAQTSHGNAMPAAGAGAVSSRFKRTKISTKQFERSWPNEFRILASRAMRIASRAKVANIVRGIQTLLFAFVLGILWISNGRHRNFDSRNSLTGLFFFMCINQAFIGVFSVIFNYPEERSIVTRERASGSYRTSSYFIAKSLTDLPRTASFSLIFTFFVYFFAGLKSGFGPFLQFYLIVLGCSLFGESLGVTISIVTGNAQASAALCPTIIIISVLFGGFFIKASLIPGWVRWIKNISFVYYAFNAFAKAQYNGTPFGAQVLSNSGFNDLSYWTNFVVLYAIIFAFNLIGYLTLEFLRGPKFLSF